jgi:mRNA interferase MazF
MERGEIWWTELEEPEGSGPGFRRPVLIIQTDGFNRSLIETTIVAALTSNLRLADAPGNVLLPAKASGLPKDSVINVSQILTLEKSNLSVRVSRIPARYMRAVTEGLKLVLLP